MTEAIQSQHLSDQQMTEVLLGAEQADARAHFRECDACRAEVAQLSSMLGQLAAQARKAAERPTGFWYAQRSTIAERLRQSPARSRPVAWAAALTMVVLAAFALTQVTLPPTPAVSGEGALTQAVDPDHQLLLEIEDSLRRPVPRPFEPALLVTQELTRAAEGTESSP